MAVHGDLPWPEEWPNPRPKLWMKLAAGYLGAVTLLSVGLGVEALLAGDWWPAVFLLAGGTYLALVTSLCVLMLRPCRRPPARAISLRVTGSDEDGIVVAYSGWLYRWLAATMTLTFVFFAALTLGGLAGWVDIYPPGIISIVIVSVPALYPVVRR
jgi:hypothetical protein